MSRNIKKVKNVTECHLKTVDDLAIARRHLIRACLRAEQASQGVK